MNPYRKAFYHSQAEWHGYKTAQDIIKKHRIRVPYYRFFTNHWLPEKKDARIADLACGAGQFVYFLTQNGYSAVTGVDLDARQVELAQMAGLPCQVGTIEDFLHSTTQSFDLISMLDILEHFTLEELFPVLTLVSSKLNPGGRLLFSVPNAESPFGFHVRHNDITHELAFSEMSLAELMRCHNLTLEAVRDPFPTPIDLPRRIYRCIAHVGRFFEGLRLRACGLVPPKNWSPVIWGVARKH